MVIVDTGLANVFSVVAAFERIGAIPQVTSCAETIRSAERVVFPGVGSAIAAMRKIKEKGLDQLLPRLTQPVLGICLGMQLMFETSEEGGVNCLGIFKGAVRRMQQEKGRPVPHMGWNRLCLRNSQSRLLHGVADGSHVYYVHSYAAGLLSSVSAHTVYGAAFAAVVEKDNFYGCQFHPERSGETGQRILTNFLDI